MEPDKTSSQKINASLPEQRTDEHFTERHEYILRRIKEDRIRLLFLGDSITRRWFDNPGLWDAYFRKYQPANFGIGSDTTQSFLWRIQNGELDGINPEVTVLLIGTNNLPTNTEEEIVLALKKILEVIRQKLPETIIILLGLLPRNRDETGIDHISMIERINHELFKMANNRDLRFLDFGSLLKKQDGTVNTEYMPDGLHLIEPGYRIWGESIKPLLEEIMT